MIRSAEARETMGMGDIDVEGSDINSRPDGFGRGEGMGRDQMISRKLLISFIYEGIDLSIGWR